MFSALKFRDVFTEVATGFPAVFVNAGSSVGSAISMIGARKAVFHVVGGTNGAGSAVLLLAAASVSTGTGSAFLNGSSSVLTTAVNSATASQGVAVVEVRGEYLEQHSVGPWLFPVLSVSGGSLAVAVTAHTFLRNYEPASNYDTASYTKSELLLL